jgi:MFS family permease
LATLPVTGYVVGGALSSALGAKTQALWGRKRSFQMGLVVAALSARLCAYAAPLHRAPCQSFRRAANDGGGRAAQRRVHRGGLVRRRADAVFLIALFTLGVGWNFLFVGATTLLTTAYRNEERIKTQGAMDFCIFTTMALTSFASGALVTTSGWDWLNRGSIVPLLAIAVALWWLGAVRRRAGAVVTA